MKFILEIFLTGLAILIVAQIIPGVVVNGYLTALIAGILLGVVNATIGLILRILTFPLNILTLGLISFIISVFMVLLVSHILNGFYVHGFFSAALFAIALALIKMLFHSLEKSR
ncbi:putative membrane protein [Mucilaginibacter gracilis]|uniref:Putative membrane protein n=2 Tax=Mucilaginibacter gracilis TaxID=423350 RepID=A0A495IV49_9SPHI|nr:phage holin family protein [Mucilaginibacter gracilis]RKR80181.1 putative membrane protein [Mucilaginibacter gracilis]